MRKSIAAGAVLLLSSALGGVGIANSAANSSAPQTTFAPGPPIQRGERDLKDIPVVAEAQYANDSSIRLAGADRYETSTLISRQAWTPEVAGVVFLATGENYPDALSVSGSFAGAGPILLTRPNELPAVVEREIARLQPCVVVVIGSQASVSDRVQRQAAQLANPRQWKCNA